MRISKVNLKITLKRLLETEEPLTLALQGDHPHQTTVGRCTASALVFLDDQDKDGSPILLLEHPAIITEHEGNMIVMPMNGIEVNYYTTLDRYNGFGVSAQPHRGHYKEWLLFHLHGDVHAVP